MSDPKTIYFVGPWDLHRNLACIPEDPKAGLVLLVESRDKGAALPWHRQKLVLVLSAMHHFAASLRAEGYTVEVRNAQSYVAGIKEQVTASSAERIVAVRPREWGIYQSFLRADEAGEFGAQLELHDDGGPGGHFLLTHEAWQKWARGRKQFRMQDFYKWMRQRSGWLMDDGKPMGGKWSFDSANRKKPKGIEPPEPPSFVPDETTRECIDRVKKWPQAWGDVDDFSWPVTRAEALEELEHFFSHRAEHFGPYQDAMLSNQAFMWHLRLAPAMNLGLIEPSEVCERIDAEYRDGNMSIESAEGLLRQILGWREFIRGMYWQRMPSMRTANTLKAKASLPILYWEPESTDMNCLRQSVGQVKKTGYAHHIQRLMVLGNFALLAGVAPLELSHWFWAGFVDAYEWVQLPNVHGMALFADDGFTTKPYAASASYIHKMSDYCGDCRYRHQDRVGDDACPFNYLYWYFMDKHRERLSDNPRIGMLYRTWDKWSEEQREEILENARSFLRGLPRADHDWSFHDDQG